MKRQLICFILVIFMCGLTSCEFFLSTLPDNAFRAAPDSSLSANFINECSDYFSLSKDHEADQGKCQSFGICLSQKMRNTALSNDSAWSTVEKIAPNLYGYPTLIPEMKANAQAAGPKAMEIFQLINNMRHQCIEEVDLSEVMPIYKSD